MKAEVRKNGFTIVHDFKESNVRMRKGGISMKENAEGRWFGF